jgi:predicted CoA-binding protein
VSLDTPELARLLADARTIAVVGLSDKPSRPSHGVASYLQEAGYRVIPVNPNISETLGERAYPSLRDVPVPVDIVDIFRRSEFVPQVIDDAIAVRARAVWMQVGVIHEEAAVRARAAGLLVIMNLCLATTHVRLKGQDLP